MSLGDAGAAQSTPQQLGKTQGGSNHLTAANITGVKGRRLGRPAALMRPCGMKQANPQCCHVCLGVGYFHKLHLSCLHIQSTVSHDCDPMFVQGFLTLHCPFCVCYGFILFQLNERTWPGLGVWLMSSE